MWKLVLTQSRILDIISDKTPFKLLIYVDLNSHLAYKNTCIIIVVKPCVIN